MATIGNEIPKCIYCSKKGACRNVPTNASVDNTNRKIILTIGRFPSLATHNATLDTKKGLVVVKAKCDGFGNPELQKKCDSYPRT